MTDEYVKMMDELEAAGIRNMRDHYNFSYDPIASSYDTFFEFSTTHLKKKEKELGYPPCYLYIKNDPTINAYAASTDKYKIIGFHHGCFKTLFWFFHDQEELLKDDEFESLHKMLAHLGNYTSYSFFQYFMMFLYFHEFAHLVQGSRKSNAFHFSEYVSGIPSCKDILYCHSREMDADWLACNACGLMIVQFFLDDQNQFNGTAEGLTMLTAVALTAIFCYFFIATG